MPGVRGNTVRTRLPRHRYKRNCPASQINSSGYRLYPKGKNGVLFYLFPNGYIVHTTGKMLLFVFHPLPFPDKGVKTLPFLLIRSTWYIRTCFRRLNNPPVLHPYPTVYLFQFFFFLPAIVYHSWKTGGIPRIHELKDPPEAIPILSGNTFLPGNNFSGVIIWHDEGDNPIMNGKPHNKAVYAPIF